MIRHLLVDYGEVISTPLPEETIIDLAALAGRPRATFLDRYWHHRPAYDLGQPVTDYWSEVLDRDLSGSPRIVNRLTNIDVFGWLRLNPRTLPTLLSHVRRTRTPMALLSNAPEPLAQGIDVLRWSQHFDHRYYSCRLGAAKPDPQAFQLVLRDLGVQPGEVLFIDDRAENTRTARDLGMHTITFRSAWALDRELRLTSPAVRLTRLPSRRPTPRGESRATPAPGRPLRLGGRRGGPHCCSRYGRPRRDSPEHLSRHVAPLKVRRPRQPTRPPIPRARPRSRASHRRCGSHQPL